MLSQVRNGYPLTVPASDGCHARRTYTVRGMTCGHCELSVTEEVSEVGGVTTAEADRSTGRLVVRGEARRRSQDHLRFARYK
jgi:copper chaperone CopZ